MKTKICTDIEQSKKLVKLGIDVDTADMYWHKKIDGTLSLRTDNLMVKLDTPAWSLSALLGLMPFQIIDNNQRFGFRQWKGYNSQGETYRYEYVSNIGDRLYETYHLNNPVDAAFEMICWLKENDKL